MKIYNLYIDFRSRLANTDVPYRAFINLIGLVRPHQRRILVDKDCEIVIEGFPRSANTYFVSYFEVAQNRSIKIAQHLHESYQIRYAEKNNIPCIVLIRDPLDAVSSAILRDPRASAQMLLKTYIRFYENIFDHRKKFIIAPFNVAITSPEKIIENLNAVYGTEFTPSASDKVDSVKERVEMKDRRAFKKKSLDPTRIAVPSEEKKKLAEKIRNEILSTHMELLSNAQSVYLKNLGSKT